MAIVYFNSPNVVNNNDGVILGIQSNIEVGSFNGHFQYAEPLTSGLVPEETILGVGSEGSPLLGQYDDQALNRGIRNIRVQGLPSGYGGQYGQPTFGSGRTTTNTTLGADYGLTASGQYNYSNGRNVQHKKYNALTS